MKTKLHKLLIALALIAGVYQVAAQGTAFTYQGQLRTSAGPANGTYDLTFALWNASSGGSQVGTTVTASGTIVSNGLFTVTLDFGGVFTGPATWLQLGVRTNGAVLFSPLTPRQELTPTPYSITAENVDGLVPASQLTGTLGTGLFPVPLDLSGSIASPIIEADQSGAGTSIYGSQLATTGTAPGIEGATSSTSSDAAGVYGLVSSTSPGGASAAVRGQNNGTGFFGIGVYGSQAGSGYGVYGYAPNGFGVYGQSGTSTGVYAVGATGVSAVGFTGDGVDATSSSAIGVHGIQSGLTSTNAGVKGDTASTNASAVAVYGLVSSTSPGPGSMAIEGQNNDTGSFGIGVYGTQAGDGFGVEGYVGSGIGVYGQSDSEYGVLGLSGTGIGVYAAGVEGLDASGTTLPGVNSYSTSAEGVYGTSYSGIGVHGMHTATTNTSPGVEGETYSGDPYAVGVYGLVNSTSPGGFSAAVRGQNNGTGGGGIGVWGSQAGSGWGGYFTSSSGIGVNVSGGSGTGIQTGGGTSALTITSGAIHITGASTNSTSTAAFTQVATASNTVGDLTIINNTLCNGDPNAILIVTPNYNPHGGPGNFWNHTVGVYYNGSQWTIFNEDNTAMPAGPAFNVLILKN